MSELEKVFPEETLEINEVDEVKVEEPETEEVVVEPVAAPEDTVAEETVEEPEEVNAAEVTAEQVEQTEEAPEEPVKEKVERQPKKEGISEKRRKAMVTDSQYLRYIAEMRKADSELAIAKAQSAELVMQMDRFKKHYAEYEKRVSKLLQNIDENYSEQKKEMANLSEEIKRSNADMEERLDEELNRLTAEVGRGQGIKFFLLLVSSICSPVVLILMILSMLNII